MSPRPLEPSTWSWDRAERRRVPEAGAGVGPGTGRRPPLREEPGRMLPQNPRQGSSWLSVEASWADSGHPALSPALSALGCTPKPQSRHLQSLGPQPSHGSALPDSPRGKRGPERGERHYFVRRHWRLACSITFCISELISKCTFSTPHCKERPRTEAQRNATARHGSEVPGVPAPGWARRPPGSCLRRELRGCVKSLKQKCGSA